MRYSFFQRNKSKGAGQMHRLRRLTVVTSSVADVFSGHSPLREQ